MSIYAVLAVLDHSASRSPEMDPWLLKKALAGLAEETTRRIPIT